MGPINSAYGSIKKKIAVENRARRASQTHTYTILNKDENEIPKFKVNIFFNL